MSNEELNTTQAAATIAILLLLIVPIAVGLAAWFKRRYTAAVVELQSATAGAAPAGAPIVPAPAAPEGQAAATPALTLDVRPAAEFTPDNDASRPARRLRTRVLVVQFIGGLLYWWSLLLVVGIGLAYYDQVAGSGQDAPTSSSALATHMLLWPLLVMPAALAWAFQSGARERHIWFVGGVAMLCFGIGIALSGSGWLAGGVAAAACALLAFMMVAFMRPAVRSAGPPLVAALIVGLLALSALLWIAVKFDTAPEDAPTTLKDLAIEIPLLLAMLALAGYVAWRMLLRLARQYTAKRFSEVQLAFGAYWGLISLFTLAAVLLLSFEERTGAAMELLALAVLLLWLAWRRALRVALSLACRSAADPLGALLLLRVFKPSERSEAFTDRFLARWRFAAPVWMIAGPDLAGAYMEPDEFFAYLGKQLRQRFIADPAEVPARVARIDNMRDPDGRFRATELFCTNTTWQHTVLALIERASVILLDLREYHPQRAGTRFELTELLRRAPLSKVLVVVGANDDLEPIRAEIAGIWQKVGGACIDADKAPVLQLVTLGEGSDTEMLGLLRAVAAAARAQHA